MPVYNTKEVFLRKSIESILTQTYENFEFIILNDGSKTNVEEVILSYPDNRIRYYKNNENKGLAYSRNRLLSLASGEYINIFDSDDIALSETIKKQVTFMEKNLDVGILGGGYIVIDENDRHIKEVLCPENHKEIERELLFHSNPISNQCAMIRKSVIDQYKISYPEEFSFSEDFALWCECVGYTKFHNLNEPVAKYRVVKNSTSRVASKEMGDCYTRIRKKLQQRVLKLRYFFQIKEAIDAHNEVCITDIKNAEKELLVLLKQYPSEDIIGMAKSVMKKALRKCRFSKEYCHFLWSSHLLKKMNIGMGFKISQIIKFNHTAEEYL